MFKSLSWILLFFPLFDVLLHFASLLLIKSWIPVHHIFLCELIWLFFPSLLFHTQTLCCSLHFHPFLCLHTSDSRGLGHYVCVILPSQSHEHNISRMLWGSFFKIGTNVQNWHKDAVIGFLSSSRIYKFHNQINECKFNQCLWILHEVAILSSDCNFSTNVIYNPLTSHQSCWWEAASAGKDTRQCPDVLHETRGFALRTVQYCDGTQEHKQVSVSDKSSMDEHCKTHLENG